MIALVSGREMRELDRVAALPARGPLSASSPRVRELISQGLPQRGLPVGVNRWRRANLRFLWSGARRVLAAQVWDIPTVYGALWLRVLRADGRRVELGLASLRVVTMAGCGYLVQNFLGAVNIADFRYHGIGTGTAAPASSDTALARELATQYSPANTRATGSQSVGAAANIYTTIGTNTCGAAGVAVTEHGIFSHPTPGGGVLLDRSVFAVVTLNAGDSIQTPYSFVQAPGG